MQVKYKYYCSCCSTIYILNTLQLHHFNFHSCMHTIEIDPAEAELELQEEIAQAEASANPDQAQGKPRCIPPIILVFSFESLLYNKLDYALSL
jgi:hypothetical protein